MKTHTIIIALLLAGFMLVSCDEKENDKAVILYEIAADVKDVDGNSYKAVRIGEQTWMAENLNVSHFRNGDPILHVTSNYEWFEAGEKGIPAWRYYNDDPELGKKFGKLYNAFAVNDPRRLAPEGWRIPADSDWSELFTLISGSEPHKSEAGFKKDGEEEFTYRIMGYRWNDAARAVKRGNWTDEVEGPNNSGFGALPTGYVDSYGNFYYKGQAARWWGTPSDSEFSRFMDAEFDFSCAKLRSGNNIVSLSAAPMQAAGYSVRLIKD